MQVSSIVKEIGAKRRVQISQAVQDLTDVGTPSSDSRFSRYVRSKDSWYPNFYFHSENFRDSNPIVKRLSHIHI